MTCHWVSSCTRGTYPPPPFLLFIFSLPFFLLPPHPLRQHFASYCPEQATLPCTRRRMNYVCTPNKTQVEFKKKTPPKKKKVDPKYKALCQCYLLPNFMYFAFEEKAQKGCSKKKNFLLCRQSPASAGSVLNVAAVFFPFPILLQLRYVPPVLVGLTCKVLFQMKGKHSTHIGGNILRKNYPPISYQTHTRPGGGERYIASGTFWYTDRCLEKKSEVDSAKRLAGTQGTEKKKNRKREKVLKSTKPPLPWLQTGPRTLVLRGGENFFFLSNPLESILPLTFSYYVFWMIKCINRTIPP